MKPTLLLLFWATTVFAAGWIVWSWRSGVPVTIELGGQSSRSVYGHVVHRNGRLLVKGGVGETPTYVIDLVRRRLVRRIDSGGSDQGDISTDGRFYLVRAYDEIRIVDTASGRVLATQEVDSVSQSAGYRCQDQGSPNGYLVFRARMGGEWRIHVWEPERAGIFTVEDAPGRPFLVAGGRALLTVPSGSDEGFVYFWNLTDLGTEESIKPTRIPYPDTFKKIVAAPDLETIYIGADSGEMRVWSPATARLIRSVDIPGLHEVFALPNGKVMTTSGLENCQMWDGRMSILQWEHKDPGWVYDQPIFSDDGEWMFCFSNGGPRRSYRVLSTRDGSVVDEIQTDGDFLDAHFRKDSCEVAILTTTSVVLWDATTDRVRVLFLEEHGAERVWHGDKKIVLTDGQRVIIFRPTFVGGILTRLFARSTGYARVH